MGLFDWLGRKKKREAQHRHRADENHTAANEHSVALFGRLESMPQDTLDKLLRDYLKGEELSPEEKEIVEFQLERVCEQDDELLEQYLNDELFSENHIEKALSLSRKLHGAAISLGEIAEDHEYCRRCLAQQYKELDEPRSWDSDPVFRNVLDPLNSGDDEKVCKEAETLVSKFADFADIYYWWGKALTNLGDFNKAREILSNALEKTRQKYPLLALLGEIEYKTRNIEQAVYWWSQGMHCQESLSEQNFGGDVGAYLYLYYVADGLGLSDCASAFLMRVDQIRPGEIRFNSETAGDLMALAETARNTQVPDVLHQLVTTYLVPKKKATTKADTEEVDRLIRQLEEGDKLGWSSDKNVEAAKRLGELGDPRAIEPLTRAMRDLSLELQMTAEEAIKKIKEADR